MTSTQLYMCNVAALQRFEVVIFNKFVVIYLRVQSAISDRG